MKPSEVRDYIGRQHIQLRILFVGIDHQCREEADCRRAILQLVHEVQEHITLEDRLLLPALREVDGWGNARADRVAVEHGEQREQLAALHQLAKHGPVEEASRSARALIAALLVDMDAEERDLLSPNLLRDDVIVIDQSGG